jgi:hypothetical protein
MRIDEVLYFVTNLSKCLLQVLKWLFHGERPYWWVEEPANLRYLKGSVITHSPQSRYFFKFSKTKLHP